MVPGTYNLRASAEGLVAVGIPNVHLLVNQPVTINVQFTEVGSVTEIVSVEAETSQVNTVDASIGNAVGTRPILQLPFEARNVVNLLSLQPGVSITRDTVEVNLKTPAAAPSMAARATRRTSRWTASTSTTSRTASPSRVCCA